MPAPGSTEPHPHQPTLDELADADLVVLGRMPYSSNVTLLCELWPAGSRPDGGLGDDEPEVPDGAGPCGRAIYKPHRGERPLWDFPDGLYRREVGAYELARALGWDVVPPTVERDGPFGPGSVQAFVDADHEEHYFTFLEDESLHPQLRRMAAYDLVANSTDRKGGHLLADDDRHLWAIDNGLCLHAEFKLRTVIWEFGGEPIPEHLLAAATRISAAVPLDVAALLDDDEVEAIAQRAAWLATSATFPVDHSGRRYPWPLV